MPAVASFDPYHAWLGIEPREQPADYYRLLGVPRYEADAGRIARAADERMALVRSYQVGPRGIHTQKLLNELSAARVCLLTSASKSAYDAALIRQASAPPSFWPAPPIVPPPVPPPREQPRPVVEVPPEDLGPIEIAAPQPWWRPIAAALVAALSLLVAVGGFGLVRSRWPASVERPVEVPPPQPPASPPPPEPIVILQEGSGAVTLSPSTAALRGGVELQVLGTEEALAHWTTTEDSAAWRFRLVQPGFFQAELTYATSEIAEDAALELMIGERVTPCTLRNSGGLDRFHSDLFTVVVPTNGEHMLVVRPLRQPAGEWLILKTVRLVPVGGNLPEVPGEREALAP